MFQREGEMFLEMQSRESRAKTGAQKQATGVTDAEPVKKSQERGHLRHLLTDN